jgi:hypothetical protein
VRQGHAFSTNRIGSYRIDVDRLAARMTGCLAEAKMIVTNDNLLVLFHRHKRRL